MATSGDGSSLCHHSLSLLDLPHEDILYQHVFRRLPLSSLFLLRASSTTLYHCVSDYFHQSQKLDLTHVPPKFGVSAFNIISKEMYNLRTMYVRNSKGWLTPSILTPVISGNPRLEKIDITNCTSLDNNIITKLVSCTSLEELNFRDCHWLHPDSLTQLLWLRGVHVTRLDVGGCWELNNTTLFTIGNSCKK